MKPIWPRDYCRFSCSRLMIRGDNGSRSVLAKSIRENAVDLSTRKGTISDVERDRYLNYERAILKLAPF